MIKNNTIRTPSFLLNLIVTGPILVFLFWLISQFINDGLYPLASALSAIAVFIGLVYLRPRFTPYRWLGAGIVLAMLFIIYPILYTFYISVTNMGSGHLMTKAQAIERIENLSFIPENGLTFTWTAFKSPDNEYALWLQPKEGAGLLAKMGEPLEEVTPGEDGIGELDEAGVPVSIEGYQRMQRKDVVPIIQELSAVTFGVQPETVRIRSLGEAIESEPLYQYDAARDVMVNQKTGEVYTPIEGTFTSETGETLTPGYITFISGRHFIDFLGNEGFRKPLMRIFSWSVTFAVLSVLISFAVGLVATLMFDDLQGKRIIRALLIIPWPIPVLVSVLIWRSMLHPDMGFVAPILVSLFGSSPAWFQNAFWTRFALVMVNVWLSYPYFYVISTGALRAIPEEIYSAAIVDGAGPWQKFYYITLPLLLQILAPLLIASFTFNFNNFNVIYIFNLGNPPMADTIVPMGQTDILVSFVYRLAFVTSNVTDFGLAGAITIMLFVVIAIIVILQIRYAKLFKEVD